MKQYFKDIAMKIIRRIFSKSKNNSEPEIPTTKEISEPKLECRAYQGLKGLTNFGNSCFMSSAIQCLANTILLLEFILNNVYLKEIKHTTTVMKGNLVKSFVEGIKEIWSPHLIGEEVDLTKLKREIEGFAPTFAGYCQHDAQEFLKYLLQGLHEELNRASKRWHPPSVDEDALSDQEKALLAWKKYINSNKSKIIDIFGGLLKSTLKCRKCGSRSVTFEAFWDLSLPVTNDAQRINITQCMELLTKKEIFSARCEKCGMNREFSRKYSIARFPRVLMVHLKRFTPANHLIGTSKITKIVDFPINDWNLKQFSNHAGSYIYDLYAVCNHIGNTFSGHYTAYCKHPYTGQWHEFDDGFVAPMSEYAVVSKQAYILFYALRTPKDVKNQQNQRD